MESNQPSRSSGIQTPSMEGQISATDLVTTILEQAIQTVDPRYVHIFNTTASLLDPQQGEDPVTGRPLRENVTSDSITNPSRLASRRLSQFVLNSVRESVSTNIGQQGEMTDVPVTLSEDLLDLVKVTYVYEDNCCICLDDIKNEHAKELPCKHLFHTHCIDNWLLNEKVTCPMCRVDLRETLNISNP